MKHRIVQSNFMRVALLVAVLLLAAGVFACVYVPHKPVEDLTTRPASQTKEAVHDAYKGIEDDDIQHGGGILEYAWDLSSPYYFYDSNPIAAIVHIDSIDGGRNFSPISEQYVYPQTIGKMTVIKAYKGDVVPGQQLHYARMGGIITYDEYWNGLNDAQRDKILHLNGGKRPAAKKYVQEKPMDDIDVEVGKQYLVFLQPQSSKDGAHKEYLMNGAQYGLREAKDFDAEMMVLNSETQEWESLRTVVRLN